MLCFRGQCDYQYRRYRASDCGCCAYYVYFDFGYYRLLPADHRYYSGDVCHAGCDAAGYFPTMNLIDLPLIFRPNWTPKPATHCSSYVFYHLEFSTTFVHLMRLSRWVPSTAIWVSKGAAPARHVTRRPSNARDRLGFLAALPLRQRSIALRSHHNAHLCATVRVPQHCSDLLKPSIRQASLLMLIYKH